MCPIPPETNLPPPEPEREPRWRREHNYFAIGLVIVLHLVLGMFMWLSNARKPTPKQEARSVDVVIFEAKVQEKEIPEPKPEPKKVEPPPADIPPMPDLPPVKPESPVPAPPVVDATPAPAPAVAAPPPPPPPPPPPVAKAAPDTPPKLFEECADSPDRNMVADVYILRNGTTSVTEMKRRKPVKRVCLSQLNIAPRDFREGFPGLGTTEWFGLDIRFTVNVAEAGTWELMLLSDDGAILSIDDRDVINNDGIHAPLPETATVSLDKGLRNFRVRYFQGPSHGFLALILGWKKPGAADFDYLPRKLIGRPPAGMLAPIQPKD